MTSPDSKSHKRFTFAVAYRHTLSFEQIAEIVRLNTSEGPAKTCAYIMRETGLPLHQANPLRKTVLLWNDHKGA